MAELYGKATGCSKGKGGSMHFFAPDRNYWGGHGIVGGQIPLGTGLAYALKYKGLKGAAMAFMGDGAVNQGAVHEAYNLAALWQSARSSSSSKTTATPWAPARPAPPPANSPSAPPATTWHGIPVTATMSMRSAP
jgi:hypothetical protein